MSHPRSHNGGGSSFEADFRHTAQRAQENLTTQIHRCEDAVRESPANSVLIAALIGYFLHLLPIQALLASIVRLLAALVRPAIFLYVGARLIDLLRAPSPAPRASEMPAALTP